MHLFSDNPLYRHVCMVQDNKFRQMLANLFYLIRGVNRNIRNRFSVHFFRVPCWFHEQKRTIHLSVLKTGLRGDVVGAVHKDQDGAWLCIIKTSNYSEEAPASVRLR